MNYTAVIGDRTIKARGTTIEEAALHVGKRLYGQSLSVHRTTGYYGLSGFFRAYKSDKRFGGMYSVGSQFHMG